MKTITITINGVPDKFINEADAKAKIVGQPLSTSNMVINLNVDSDAQMLFFSEMLRNAMVLYTAEWIASFPEPEQEKIRARIRHAIMDDILPKQ